MAAEQSGFVGSEMASDWSLVYGAEVSKATPQDTGNLTDMQLRPFVEDDYPAFAALYCQVYEAAPKSEAELRYADARFEPPYLHSRWLAVAGQILLGWAEYAQHAAFDPPGQFALELGVLPAAHALKPWLYERLIAEVRRHRPHALRTEVDEPEADFYRERGFREVKRNVSLRLELSGLDDAHNLKRLEDAKAQGYSFVTFSELEGTDAGVRALYELLRELVADVPSSVPRTPWNFEQFLAHRRNSPTLFPEVSVVVRQGETLIGVSELKRTNEPRELMTSLTAVRRAHRGRGLARAAKLCSLEYARERGFTTVVTQNASSNEGMLAVNARLGFQPFRTRVELYKRMEDAALGGPS